MSNANSGYRMWDEIREVSDGEIREFVAHEQSRLGDVLEGFFVTWCRTEKEYHLELSSRAKYPAVNARSSLLFGCGLLLARKSILSGMVDNIESVQCAGRAFYYLWRKEIPNLKRDLSKQ